MNSRKFCFGIRYVVRAVPFRQKWPLLLAVVITDRCNLGCFSCQGSNAGAIHCTWDHSRNILARSYERGHRLLSLTGGEPMLWDSAAPPGRLSSSTTLTKENEEYFEEYARKITSLGIFARIAFNFLTASPAEIAQMLSLKPSALLQILRLTG